MAITLGVSAASGATVCTGSNYACYKYGTSSALTDPATAPTQWESFSPNELGSGNKFTSNTNKEGQFIKKDDTNKFLGVGLNSSSLILQSLDKTQVPSGLHDKNPIMFYVDVTDRTEDNIFQLKADSSVLVGNIQIKDRTPQTSSSTQSNPVATLTFTGNKNIDEGDLLYIYKEGTTLDGGLTGNVRKPDTQTNKQYALVGGVFNGSAREVKLAFESGAKMFGDLYTTSSANSKTEATFRGASGGTTTVFDGGIQAVNGSNTLTVEAGNVNAESATFGNYGILAQNNGKNTLTFSDSSHSQSLSALGIIANAQGGNTGTSNEIKFSDTTQAGKIIVERDVTAQGGTNTLDMSTGSGQIFIQGALVTKKSSGDRLGNNTIKIKGNGSNGSMLIGGKTTLESSTAGQSIGISNFGGTTTIWLQANPNGTTSGSNYNQYSTLIAPRVYASGQGLSSGQSSTNNIVLDGDLVLSYVNNSNNRNDAQRGVFGGDILAANGGVNNITIQGTILTTTLDSSNSGGKGDATKMVISSYGSDTSKNSITILGKSTADSNTDGKVDLGTIYSSAGSNEIKIHGATGSSAGTGKVTIENITSSNYGFYGSNPSGSAGSNTVLIRDRNQAKIKTIKTIAGSTTVAMGRTAASGNAKEQSSFSFQYDGGKTELILGQISSSGSGITVLGNTFTNGVRFSLDGNSGITKKYGASYGTKSSLSDENYLKLQTTYDNTGGSKKLTVQVTGLAVGSIEKFGSSPSLVFDVQKDSAIVGASTSSAFKDGSSSDVTLQDGAKFVFQDSSSLNALTLHKSTNSDTDPSKLATLDMSSTVIDLATDGIADVSKVADHRAGTARTLKVTSLTVSNGTSSGVGGAAGTNAPLFRLYTDGVGKTDNVEISNAVSADTKVEAQVFLNTNLLNHNFGSDSTKTIIFKETRTGSSGTSTSNLNLGDKTKLATTGFTSYSLAITKETEGSDTIWRLGGVQNKQVNTEAVEYTTSAMGINYGIFVQNINSLNKRMGELRNNDDTQGVWARVFAGGSTNTMDLIPATSTYVTVQGGYDYGFGVTGGTNYLGVALSYGYTSSETDRSTNAIASITGYSSKSSNIEVAVYNSYIQDEGWFSDTIAKFGYIMSDFDIYEQSSTQKQSLSNFALSLGQEVGYRFALGSEKNWFIDPQVELVAGYINSTDLSQAQGGQILDGKLDSVFLFRTRVGSDFGYSLKKDKNQYDFRLGLSYEYDVANADAFFDIASANMSKVFSNAVDNDGRVVLNLGTNMKFGENMRLYFDFEKSFAGKITTDYQVNLGFRYGFGEKLVKVVEETNTQEKAPLKIENTQTQEQPQNQVQ